MTILPSASQNTVMYNIPAQIANHREIKQNEILPELH